jgi:hypothetical protein
MATTQRRAFPEPGTGDFALAVNELGRRLVNMPRSESRQWSYFTFLREKGIAWPPTTRESLELCTWALDALENYHEPSF